jgi:ribonuclease J
MEEKRSFVPRRGVRPQSGSTRPMGRPPAAPPPRQTNQTRQQAAHPTAGMAKNAPTKGSELLRPQRSHRNQKQGGHGRREHRFNQAVQAPPLPLPAKPDALRVYALGGLEEIGRNCTIVEMGDDIVIVDMGLMFPEEGMPGIDYIIPDISCLRGKEKNIRGVIITHGHYDHIGGIPHLMPKLGWPIVYTAPLSAGIIRKRQEEYGNLQQLKIQIVKNADEKIRLGKNFVFEPFHVNHNITDAFGAAIHTPYGTLIFTGDFKFDLDPVPPDLPADPMRLAAFGEKGVLMLMADSTSASSPGRQISESIVSEELYGIVSKHQGRIIVGTFSSLLTRVQQLLTIAERTNRKVLLLGRSMQSNVEISHQLGYMKFKPGTIVDENDLKHIDQNKLLVICTGAQGEKNAALMRIANREHRTVQIEGGDMIIFSSSVIPGNERTVQSLKDTLIRQGAKVVHYANMDVHAGGHAKQEEIKEMIKLTKPKYYAPAHGNLFLRYDNAGLAEEVGIPKDNIFLPDNGQIIEIDANGASLLPEKYPIEYIMVDGLGVGDVSHVVLRDRLQLAADGMFVIICTLERDTGRLIGSPDIISRGFVYIKEAHELVEKARAKVKKILHDSDRRSPTFEEYTRNKIRDDIGQFLWSATKRRPMVLPVIIEV